MARRRRGRRITRRSSRMRSNEGRVREVRRVVGLRARGTVQVAF
jgi:hypothetical protein